MYRANKGSLEDETGKQILVMVKSNCSQKRVNEICKLTANWLNGVWQRRGIGVETPRFKVKRNNCGGPGWCIIDSQTGRSIAWVFDRSNNGSDERDEARAQLFADALNGEPQP